MKKAARFVKNADGTITDNLQKVVWGKTLSARMTWDAANKACKKLSKGWRLPTVNELFSLVDRSKRNPAINTEFFPDTRTNDWYWASDPLAGSSGSAWIVAARTATIRAARVMCVLFVPASELMF